LVHSLPVDVGGIVGTTIEDGLQTDAVYNPEGS
jgi:hypothetical protein